MFCVNLTHFLVAQNNLHATFETGDVTHIVNRLLQPHEITRHSQNPILSYYFLVQYILQDFEAHHDRIESMVVLCQVATGSPLHFVLFVKDWTVGGCIFDTPLARVIIRKPYQLPIRDQVLRG
jgi:hypothetical protein